ncbi:hypothetical protein ACFE04_023977 [Oxalis oulophora]
MARLLRPFRQWPTLQHHRCISPSLTSLTSSTSITSAATWHHHNSLSYSSSSHHHPRGNEQPRALKLPNTSTTARSNSDDETDSDSDNENNGRRSRNEKKRLAKRAVRWGMELAVFSTPQIKRILKAASLEREVYEAIMLVKRLRPDVREGKRRQFSYIGKLLRDVEPEVMDPLIQATKDGDHDTLKALAGVEEIAVLEDDDDDDDDSEEDLGSSEYIDVATRWVDGMINKDSEITKEVYAVNALHFDRQELRKLVREVHAVNEEDERAMKRVKKPLTRFLCNLAKQISTE